LMPGETPSDILNEEVIHRLIAPYTDPSQVDIYRKRVYNFSAIIAERWQEGRVFLAGDAAHMTPPFAGQGLNSGMRDVRNLSWKLAMTVSGYTAPTILDSYTEERWDHARELIQFALDLGEQIQPIDPQKAAERDAFFFELQKDENAIEDFMTGLAKSMLARSLEKGIVMSPGENAINGQLLLQPALLDKAGDEVLLDDLLGKGFSIIGYNCDPAEQLDANVLTHWTSLGTTTIAIGDSAHHDSWPRDHNDTLAPLFQQGEQTMALIRPDKFCLAAFNAQTASEVLQHAKELLHVL